MSDQFAKAKYEACLAHDDIMKACSDIVDALRLSERHVITARLMDAQERLKRASSDIQDALHSMDAFNE